MPHGLERRLHSRVEERREAAGGQHARHASEHRGSGRRFGTGRAEDSSAVLGIRRGRGGDDHRSAETFFALAAQARELGFERLCPELELAKRTDLLNRRSEPALEMASRRAQATDFSFELGDREPVLRTRSLPRGAGPAPLRARRLHR